MKRERQKCEIWTRVMGYMRPISFFNHGKKSEHKERKHFSESIACNNEFTTKYTTIDYYIDNEK